MNYCTKCASLYAQPGTCNCFATVAPRVPTQPVVPTQPWTPVTPTVPSGPIWIVPQYAPNPYGLPWTVTCRTSADTVS